VQDVLQADWQDAWHSPQPRSFIVACRRALFNVLMCLPKVYRPPLANIITDCG